MKFSIIIPAFNEEKNIEICVRNIFSVLATWDHEIIVVDDGSTDRTAEIVASIDIPSLSLVSRPVGCNAFGKAIKKGIDAATGDYSIIVMADLSEDPLDILKMMRFAVTKRPDAIFGTRFSAQSSITNYPPLKMLFNRIFNILVSLLFKTSYHDMSNAFKMYRRAILNEMQIASDGFDITIELPIKMLLHGKKIISIPNNWRGRRKDSPKWKLIRDGILYLKRLRLLYLEYQKHLYPS